MRATDFITDASFWVPDLFVPSAWTEHAPFAFWLVQQHRPSCLVELGTHHGFSFLAFAQAVAKLTTGTRCFAIDTWKGDEHAGFYGDEVYQSLSARISMRYSSFSQLVRSTFDDAVVYFPDSSIDLLHIDGRHLYDDVMHDFETWLPKLSPRAVVLFHDVAVREREFGAIGAWSKLAQRYPHFEFVHGWGLGVLGVGDDLPEAIRSLFAVNGHMDLVGEIRDIYARLGSGLLELSNRTAAESEIQRLKDAIAVADAENQRLAGEADSLARDRVRVADDLSVAMASIQAATKELAEKTALLDQVHSDNSSLRAAMDDLEGKLNSLTLLGQETLAELEAARAVSSSLSMKNDLLLEQSSVAAIQINDLAGEIKNLRESEAQAAALAKTRAEEVAQAEYRVRNLRGELERAHDEHKKYCEEQNRLQRSHAEELIQYKQLLTDAQDANQSLARRLRDRDDAVQRATREHEQQIAAMTSELVGRKQLIDQILQSRGWKLLSIYYRIRAQIGIRIPRRWREARHERRDVKLIRSSDLFNSAWYLREYPDVASAGCDPVVHFVRYGAREGRNPSNRFDVNYYRQRYPDVADAGVNPLAHYLRFGADEGRSCLLEGNQHQSATVDDPPASLPSGTTPTGAERSARTGRLSLTPLKPASAPVGHPDHDCSRGALVCFTHVLPYPPRAGNESRIHRLLKWFHESGYDVYLIVCPLGDYVITGDRLSEAIAHYRNLILCDRSGLISYSLANDSSFIKHLSGKEIRDFSSILKENEDPRLTPKILHCVRTFCPDALIEIVLHLAAAVHPQVVLAEYVFTSRVLPLLSVDSVKVIDTIDVFSTKQKKVEQFGIPDSLALLDAEEALLLEHADIVVAIQGEEESELKVLAPDTTIVTAGIDFDRIDVADQISSEPLILMVGSDNPMNTKGARDFIRYAWPIVRRSVPNAKVRFVGSVASVVATADAAVELVGAVENITAEYSNCRAVINPAVAGTGLKIKTVEALCHLRPLIAWPAGVEGLSDEMKDLVCVAEDWYGFALGVIDVCLNIERNRRMLNNREAIARAFSAAVIYRELGSAIEEATKAKGAKDCLGGKVTLGGDAVA